MKNLFFKLALHHASKTLGKPGRLIRLATQVISHLDRDHFSLKAIQHKLQLAVRLTSAYAKGYYRSIPVQSLLMVIAGIIYLLNPLDLVPDAVVGLGLTDDFTVLAFVFRTTHLELDKFREWETSSRIFSEEGTSTKS